MIADKRRQVILQSAATMLAVKKARPLHIFREGNRIFGGNLVNNKAANAVAPGHQQTWYRP